MTDLTFKKLTEVSVKRCEAIDGFNHSLSGWSLMEWGSATAGECGEANNIAKKIRRIELGMANRKGHTIEELGPKLAEEISDMIQYGVLWMAAAGYDIDEVITKKFNQVSDELGSGIKL